MTPFFPVDWSPYTGSDSEFPVRLTKVLRSWESTPYRPGQQCKGVGADCVRFALAVIDEMRGIPLRRLPSVPADAAWHSPTRARSGMKKLYRLYLPFDRIPIGRGRVEPGDVLVTGPRAGGPAHMIIVGARKNTLWQAKSQYIAETGWSIGNQRLMRIFRTAREE